LGRAEVEDALSDKLSSKLFDLPEGLAEATDSSRATVGIDARQFSSHCICNENGMNHSPFV
jgi:hypothetical protein